jgi:hypothetical protein
VTRSDPLSLDGIDQIPDPAAHAPAPLAGPPVPPTEPSPTRAARRARVQRGVIVGALWIAAAIFGTGLRHDFASVAALGPTATWAVTVVAGLSLLLLPRARGLPAGIRLVQHALWIVPAIFVVAVLATGAKSGDPPLSWATIKGCLAMANVAALGPLVIAALLLRHVFLSGAAWRAAAVGALAGLSGSLAVHAHCPVGSLDHLLAAHGPSIVVGAVLGAIFGRMRGSA